MTALEGPGLPQLLTGLCDDAAVFPPGLAPLSEAVRHYCDRRDSWFVALVGPLVLPDKLVRGLKGLIPSGVTVPLSMTLPGGPVGLPKACAAVTSLPVDLQSVEVAVANESDAVDAVIALADESGDLDVYVEIPRDDRAPSVLDAVSEHGLRAKFRTGGVRAEFYPDEAELAASVAAAVRVGVAYKATAGLHHAVRNTDPDTGFEQHGFLNVLLATATLLDGGDENDARAVLADRDGPGLAARLRDLTPGIATAARAAFTSFGTCSITEPLAELVELGLVAVPHHREGALQ
ncbi:hypothetical protein [Streptomyces sp. NPDC085932]|uniref:hypothetical protein n=1 Tax=Streptomyces sp. NPDC085932 TaxID=3365741 RepID=UPI0037D3EF4D